MKIRSIITILCVLAILNAFGQVHKQVFEHFAKTQIPGITEHFRFYYIVDSSKSFKLKNLLFYAFTFSEDSTEKTGYISYDKSSGDLLFVSDTVQGTKSVVRRLFPLKTSATTKTDFISNLGDELTRTVRNDTIRFTSKLTGPIKNHASHSIYLQSLEFKQGLLYPISLTFYFPFDDKGIVKLTSKQTND